MKKFLLHCFCNTKIGESTSPKISLIPSFAEKIFILRVFYKIFIQLISLLYVLFSITKPDFMLIQVLFLSKLRLIYFRLHQLFLFLQLLILSVIFVALSWLLIGTILDILSYLCPKEKITCL